MEINEIQEEPIIEKNQQSKKLDLWRINKVDKYSARLIKNRLSTKY